MGEPFSVNFEEDPACAADWNLQVRDRWCSSEEKEHRGTGWRYSPGLTRDAYEAVLGYFKLKRYRSKLPVAVVESMSPAELYEIRKHFNEERRLKNRAASISLESPSA